LNVRSPEYSGRTNPEWIRGTIETPLLDCSATISDDGWVTLAVVNVSEESDYAVTLDGMDSKTVNVFTVGGSSVDAVNTESEQKVQIKESTWENNGQFVFGKHSLTMLRWKV
jgi:alpha-N-arabinofuranosidase